MQLVFFGNSQLYGRIIFQPSSHGSVSLYKKFTKLLFLFLLDTEQVQFLQNKPLLWTSDEFVGAYPEAQ